MDILYVLVVNCSNKSTDRSPPITLCLLLWNCKYKNTVTASKFMCHSEAIHTPNYQKGYDKQNVLQTLNLLDKQQQQQQ